MGGKLWKWAFRHFLIILREMALEKTEKFYKDVYEFPFLKMKIARMIKEYGNEKMCLCYTEKEVFYECSRI